MCPGASLVCECHVIVCCMLLDAHRVKLFFVNRLASEHTLKNVLTTRVLVPLTEVSRNPIFSDSSGAQPLGKHWSCLSHLLLDCQKLSMEIGQMFSPSS